MKAAPLRHKCVAAYNSFVIQSVMAPVVFESSVRFLAGDVRIYHKDSFSGVILEQLGFARPKEQDLPDFAESMVQWISI